MCVAFLFFNKNKNYQNEYLQRYINRGNAQRFINLVERSWSGWIEQCDNQLGCSKLVLASWF